MAPNLVDVLLVVLLILALVVGLRRGLLASLGGLVGLAAGGVAAWWLLPLLSGVLPWPEARGILLVVAGVLLLAVGAGVGSAVGGVLRRGADRIRLRLIDRALGGALSVVVAALALSLVGQTVAVAGVPVVSSALASSGVLRTIDSLTPTPVQSAMAELRSVVIADGLPRVGTLIETLPTIGAAPAVDLDDPALDAAAQSVARVAGTAYACGRTSTGSGFVIAEDRVVTNAHVVAGVESPVVELPGRAAAEGRVVYFDPVVDLAVIAVDGLDAASLPLGDTLSAGDAAVVQGYPLGGPFTMGTATVRSVGVVNVPDIHDEQTAPREIYALDADVRPGNSGGPLLDADGDVAGIVFARADDDSGIGYAMTTAELAPVIAQAGSLAAPVSTGACTG